MTQMRWDVLGALGCIATEGVGGYGEGFGGYGEGVGIWRRCWDMGKVLGYGEGVGILFDPQVA